MPYSTLAQIKERLTGLTGTSSDTELTNIQSDVTRDIDRYLEKVTTLPVKDTTILAELAKHEADISSVIYYHRRASATDQEKYDAKLVKVWEAFRMFVAERFGYQGMVVT